MASLAVLAFRAGDRLVDVGAGGTDLVIPTTLPTTGGTDAYSMNINPDTWVREYTEDYSKRYHLRFFAEGDPNTIWHSRWRGASA